MRHNPFRGHARCDGHGAHGRPEWFTGLWYAIGRHRRGHDPFGGGPFGGRGGRGGFGDFGDDGMPRGRQFSSDDLQLLLLALVAEQPSHGYELIKALDTRSNGFYSPSPGMVYPALTYLEEVGFVASQAEGNRKRYALTDAGRAHLDAQRERVDTLFARLTHLARKMEFMRRAFAGESAGNETPDEAQAGWLPEFVEARLALKRALLHKSAADADEQRRIAAIMRRATAEIEGGTGA
ncbi:PadR family transcriptional regulator [Burkholderia contaminans FFH2055]|uniref:PadR family transcriptional regulator n=1 Tax=Burkholderia contaminans TaxID=488447 RepID=A0A3N8QZK3_9BURK|nr:MULTISPECIES: PadR family transcriptional regulator [Burkholderia]AOL05671.1 PadR family transcriptional regulator [Burkholderia contaminans]ELK6462807.1 PadR family transcriptional regulator [Burkholderia contaminans]KKL30907.1 PadR family transcriptional regulator [Burkholderia contaminans FFH2055]MCA7882568.1 PadR family transcriptional regulator [Burkholderia contaminans]MCA8150776.1 PadR family transcriptional regulator [Burkholderia contaminans]